MFYSREQAAAGIRTLAQLPGDFCQSSNDTIVYVRRLNWQSCARELPQLLLCVVLSLEALFPPQFGVLLSYRSFLLFLIKCGFSRGSHAHFSFSRAFVGACLDF